MRFKRTTLDYLNKYQQKTMILKVFLVKLKHKDEVLQDQLEDKKDEVERLKTELISQMEEQEDPGEDSKEFEETRKANVDLKTQLEESKRMEESLRH